MTIYSLIMLAAGSSVDLFKQSDKRRLQDNSDLNFISKMLTPVYGAYKDFVEGDKMQELKKHPAKHLENHADGHGHLHCLLFPEAKNDVMVKALTGSDLDPFEQGLKKDALNLVTKYVLYANIVTYGASFLTIPGFNWLLRLVFGKWFILFFASNFLASYYWYSYPQELVPGIRHWSLKYPVFVVSFVVVQIADTVTYIFGFGPLKWIHNILSVFFQLYYFLNFMFITAIPVYASLHKDGPLITKLKGQFEKLDIIKNYVDERQKKKTERNQ